MSEEVTYNPQAASLDPTHSNRSFKPRVLIACEYSGIERSAFQSVGCDTWSCDLLPSEIPGQLPWNASGSNTKSVFVLHPGVQYAATASSLTNLLTAPISKSGLSTMRHTTSFASSIFRSNMRRSSYAGEMKTRIRVSSLPVYRRSFQTVRLKTTG